MFRCMESTRKVLMPSHLIWHPDTYYNDPRNAHESFLFILFVLYKVRSNAEPMDTFGQFLFNVMNGTQDKMVPNNFKSRCNFVLIVQYKLLITCVPQN